MKDLERGLIVSCQAVKGEPLYGYGIMDLFAFAAKEGGAKGIRCLVDDVEAIKKRVDLPVIGLVKHCYQDSSIYITPTKKDLDKLINTSCDILCMDATNRIRPNGETLEDLVAYAKANGNGRKLLADIATLEEAIYAEKLGFDYVSTTLRGYTENTKDCALPDIAFVKEVKDNLKNAKVIAEGGFFERHEIEEVCKVNPFAIVVGSAITRPKVITERLIGALSLKDE